MPIFAATSSSSGPRCSVRRWMTRVMCGDSARAPRMAATIAGVAASPTSIAWVSTATITATASSRMPIARVPTASQTGSPVTMVRPMPASANTRPTSAARSSISTTGSSGARAAWMNSHQEAAPLTCRASATAVRRENPSSAVATSRMTIATSALSSSWGWRSFATPSWTENSPPTLNNTIATRKPAM